MNIYDFLKQKRENYQARILKCINMGHKDSSDIFEFVDEKYLYTDENNQVYIRSNQDVEISYVESNGCLQLVFNNTTSSCDVMFDEDVDYDKFFKLY
jgi:hypothetical protein